jgi:hypothetical protein
VLLGDGRGPGCLPATTSLIAMTILVARSPTTCLIKRLTSLCRRLSRASRTPVSDVIQATQITDIQKLDDRGKRANAAPVADKPSNPTLAVVAIRRCPAGWSWCSPWGVVAALVAAFTG